MGPSCAQRGVYATLQEDTSQLSFDSELGSQAKPKDKRATTRRLPSKSSLPSHLQGQLEMAKTAFDDLFREFCKNGTLLYDERALAFDNMLNSGDFEIHGFDDPLLDWLEPEYELQLFLSKDGRTAFHRRCINGTVSLLHFEVESSSSAKKFIEIIVSFSRSLRRHRNQEQMIQLSLFSAI